MALQSVSSSMVRLMSALSAMLRNDRSRLSRPEILRFRYLGWIYLFRQEVACTRRLESEIIAERVFGGKGTRVAPEAHDARFGLPLRFVHRVLRPAALGPLHESKRMHRLMHQRLLW